MIWKPGMKFVGRGGGCVPWTIKRVYEYTVFAVCDVDGDETVFCFENIEPYVPEVHDELRRRFQVH